jgi:signal transduction histidine kinase
MRLADFILENLEHILVEWEAFARTVWPGSETDPVELRDHAKDILRATAWDMKSVQSPTQQADKSKGDGDSGTDSERIDGASDVHALGRVRSGFDLPAVVAEYRALRASVIRLWRESAPEADRRDLADLTRFNESIDQSLTEAVRSYTAKVDQSRQMFLAILGHDLRNPLNSMMMLAEALSRTARLDEDSTAMTAQMKASAAAMARMISDLLDFTGSGLGAPMPIALTSMDLKPLCEEVIGEFRCAHPSRILNFRSEGDVRGEWDASRLRQLISNLLGNAVQHGGDEGAVELALDGNEPEVVFSVRNEGPAIPHDALATIFEPLVRGSPETKKQRRPGSIGLGLYIVREIARAHGGRIDVKSSADAGTAFQVRLPRRPPR